MVGGGTLALSVAKVTVAFLKLYSELYICRYLQETPGSRASSSVTDYIHRHLTNIRVQHE